MAFQQDLGVADTLLGAHEHEQNQPLLPRVLLIIITLSNPHHTRFVHNLQSPGVWNLRQACPRPQDGWSCGLGLGF